MKKFFCVASFLFFYLGEARADFSFPAAFKKVSDRPLVYVCDHFLSHEACDHLIEIARPHLLASTVVDPKSPGNLAHVGRTSLGMFISPKWEDRVVKEFQKEISAITRIPEENGESLQVLYYGIGAEYKPHYDYFDPATSGGRAHYERGGQRVATFMVYLNTPEKGGETVFPYANLKITPQKGRAVLFYNTDEEGKEDPWSLHGGAPVVKGEKWLVTRWLRERAFH